MKILATAGLALALHLSLGWAWTLLAAVAGGAWAARRGWLVGALGLALDSLALIGYSYYVAPEATAEMAHVMGLLLGNMPAFAFVGLSLLIGVILGALGGAIGAQLAGVPIWQNRIREAS